MPEDGGTYKVVFVSDAGDVSSQAVAYVKKKKPEEKTEPASFLSPLQDVTIPVGETLGLKCQVVGQPMPTTVKFYRNGEELKPDDRISIRLALDGTATLRIHDAQLSDAGDFKAVVSNGVGPEAESACVVKVLSGDELPSAPKFVIPLKPTEVDLGATAEFNVKVRGVPAPTLTFTLDGKPLEIDGSRIKLDDMGDGNWCLTIKDVKESDYGTLRAKAVNENGQDECSAKFGPSSDKGGEKDKEGYPPKFNVKITLNLLYF